jgi:CRISPR-associated protein Cas6
MSAGVPEMIDAVFDLAGESVPADYPFELWDALVALVPELAGDAATGVLPLRTTGSGSGMLLPRRAKLVVRLPAALAGEVGGLSGRELDIGDSRLRLGQGRLREIVPYSTIHAHLVTGVADEVAFIEEVSAVLAGSGIAAGLICGRRNTLAGTDRRIEGFSLVIHDLKPEDSLRLQYTGLGSDRRYGCGVFVPYKVIADLH